MPKEKPKSSDRVALDRKWAVLANGLVIIVVAYAAVLQWADFDAYRQSVQEDEYLEWATFWAFVLAACLGIAAGLRHWRERGRIPWFLTGVGLFCLFVAMEEISWGQRVLGYRPPVYFLEHNFQQELNLHNLPSTSLRKWALNAVILGYGVLLPLAAAIPAIRGLMQRIGIRSPPLTLAPSFLITFALYWWYPWKYTGEIVELALGLAFLFALLACWRSEKPPDPQPQKTPALRWLLPTVGLWAMVMVLGLANATLSRMQRSASPEAVKSAQVELDALKADLDGLAVQVRGSATRCGLHKRVYSWVEKYRRDYLYTGAFARLKNQGLPTDRADFFLDPWNSPYWIRHKCSRNRPRQTVVIYSFGPNRRRESDAWEIRGDDIAAIVRSSEKRRVKPLVSQ